MESYKSYFDRQTVSPELHEELLAIGRQPRTERRHRSPSPAWKKWAALAACCVLVLGAGQLLSDAPFVRGAFAASPSESGTFSSSAGPAAVPEDGQGATDYHGFLVEGPEAEDTFSFYALPAICYQSVDGRPEVNADLSRHFLEGSFSVDLTKAEMQNIFWGPAGRPEGADGDLPWALYWGGYTLSGSALYSGEGELLWVTLQGNNTNQESSFTLTLRPGELPFQCGIYSGLETTDVSGTEVTGWSRTDDLDGDSSDDAQCVSEFMAGDVGVRFEVRCTAQDAPMDRAELCNTLLVRQALSSDGGVYLGHLLTNEDIPAWRTAEFSSLEEARQETAFAPYLPTEDIPGYGEFSGYLTYQEWMENLLHVRWSRGYDDVAVDVSLPEGDLSYNLADVNRPETYDLRLYPIPWCDSVPEEYRDTVSMPTFRAEDMSLAVVETRSHEKDTGGLSFQFGVLHDSGVLVEYRCDGHTAQAVWELVEETLPPASP